MVSTKPKSYIVSFFVILLYLAISDFFGIFDTSLVIPGEMYDYVFVIVVCISILFSAKNDWTINKSGQFVVWPFLFLIIVSVVQSFMLAIRKEQSVWESLAVTREILYIVIVFAFGSFQMDERKIVKTIVILDILSVCVYAIEMIHGGPIFSTVIHADNGNYKLAEGIRVWRCWVDLPAFEFFTVPYLLIGIIQKNYIFGSKKKEVIALCWIFLGVILKLGRTELLAVGGVAVIAFVFTNKPSFVSVIKRMALFLLLCSIGLSLIYFFANGIYQRLLDGIIAILSLADSDSGSTLAVRTNTISVRWNYLLQNKKLLFGLGPYSYKSDLVVDPYDTYAVNRGVFSPDSAYATFLTRYGIIGTILYLYGFLRNFFLYKKPNSKLYFSVALFFLGSLIAGFSGYNSLGKQTLLKVGLLVGLCVCKEKDKNGAFLRKSV